jgi:hypothetical protein
MLNLVAVIICAVCCGNQLTNKNYWLAGMNFAFVLVNCVFVYAAMGGAS